MRLGIDVGGTNTDAVLLEGKTVLSWAKSPTTADVTDGIIEVIEAVLKNANVDRSALECVMIGTTHFTNALVERRGLLEVGIIRLGSPASEALPPMSGWPSDLRTHMGETVFLLPGGYEYDGSELTPFNEEKVRRAVKKIRDAGLRTAAVSCTFGLINPAMEAKTVAIFKEEAPDIAVTVSASFGRSGFLERENATIMNASLVDMAGHVITSFKRALDKLGIVAPFYISQNDGTLISASYAARYPVLTFGSGPTNSMRGGAFLTGLKDALVMDIGGTTTDIGALTHGFPRESSVAVDIGGVRTNFRMPDILAIGLGGGTRIHLEPDAYDKDSLAVDSFTVGPDSVGYRLNSDSYLFGGTVLTASDIAVAGGLASFGDASLLPKMNPVVVKGLLRQFQKMMEDGLDRMKTAQGKVPVILVGGGSVLVGENLMGASTVIRPEHASVANAVGAAIAQVGGEAESIVSYDTVPREEAMRSLQETAVKKVVHAGADPKTISIIDVDEVFLSYMPGNTAQLRVKAVGDLALGKNVGKNA
ncbi:hydantoinase/oxoprolinase N-terminal domain-containing protein [Kordiimonas pumila]|uniref:Hydantoinase/oxoprolinase N-terminal domain-containing protein n=1 Tax=Kordiimonas pumila TaxID=2161677 RepID=A0ABV7D829_9PROT|nr:hydantoinase/oxoprolinase family protein [Kordiimonas pumila]